MCCLACVTCLVIRENMLFFFLIVTGTSLVAQWLRIRLAVQGTQVQSLVGN